MSMQRWQVRELAPAAVAAVALPWWASWAEHWTESTRAFDALGGGIIVLASVVLAARRRNPLLVLAAVTVAITAYLWLGYTYGPIFATFLLAVYSVARHRPLPVALPAFALALLAMQAHLLVREGTMTTGSAVSMAAIWFIAPATIGIAVRQRALATARDREAQLQSRLDAERLRLSREVHDVVGHGLAAIHLQASVALRSADRDDDRARTRTAEALAAIEAASAGALGELREVLARMPGAGGENRRPRPGLVGVPALAERMSSPDRPVQVSVDVSSGGGGGGGGDPLALHAAADLAAYRVVQEALTNAVRHGTGGAEVRIRHTPQAVELLVSNPASPAAPQREGMGLPGMRERLESVGGTVSVRREHGRFEVHAVVPRTVQR